MANHSEFRQKFALSIIDKFGLAIVSGFVMLAVDQLFKRQETRREYFENNLKTEASLVVSHIGKLREAFDAHLAYEKEYAWEDDYDEENLEKFKARLESEYQELIALAGRFEGGEYLVSDLSEVKTQHLSTTIDYIRYYDEDRSGDERDTYLKRYEESVRRDEKQAARVLRKLHGVAVSNDLAFAEGEANLRNFWWLIAAGVGVGGFVIIRFYRWGAASESQPRKNAYEPYVAGKNLQSDRLQPDNDDDLEETASEEELEVLLEIPDTQKDDLARIQGIGAEFERRLNQFGIFRLSQIAAWDESKIAEMEKKLGATGRISRDNWVGQARALQQNE